VHPTLFESPTCLGVADLSLEVDGARIGPDGVGAYRSARISREQFLDDDWLDALLGFELDTVFVDLADIGFGSPNEALLSRLTARTKQHARKGAQIIPVIGGPGPLEALADHGLARFPVALKGYEASGLCGTETVSLLFDAAVCRHGWSPRDVIIWGGIATAEAAAAFFMLGVRGVVHESVHWLTSAASLSPARRRMISALSPDHTTVAGEVVGLPVRLHDKGNSRAVRDLKAKEDGLLDLDLGEARRRFLAEVFSTCGHPLNGDPVPNELVVLGPEAAFARRFAERYGEDFGEAVSKYGEKITRLCQKAPRLLDEMRSGRAVASLGAPFPIIQGGMSWITDNIDLAAAVADAGGLPTLAVGLKSREDLDREFANLSPALGGRPYAVNVIALDENPRLQEQIGWIEASRPPFVVVAAGSPAYVRRFRAMGAKVIYIAQSEDLIRLAVKEGASFIVLEGNEAGGHVGTLTGLTLAQVGLTLRQAEPELFKDAHLVLAGGIHDRVSALRAAMLGAEAVQMGTAYLASKEIVETGALSSAYQESILAAGPGDTRVTGRRVGLRVRALRTPKLEAIEALEREMAVQCLDEREARHRMESLCAGSLLVAAREMKAPGTGRLATEVCLREGQYMCGAVAGNIDHRYSLEELHAELFAPVSPLYVPDFTGRKAPLVITSAKGSRERIAITGMALNNALGRTVEEVWANTKALKCGVTEVPPSRWSHSAYFHAAPGKTGKTYCRVGAFQSLAVNRKEIGVPPQDFNTMCQSTRMTLWLAKQALDSSGILDSSTPRERIGVIVSQNSGEMGSTVADLVVAMGAGEIVETIRGAALMSDGAVEAAVARLRKGRVMVDDTTLLGRINSAAGGFICNQYGFRGPAFSVSAACATGLVALWCAYGMVRAGVLDAAVVGGSEELLVPATFMEFSALRALAGAFNSGRPQVCRPFDARRDGMVLGEGGAILIIERESLARKRGARIHAFIEGMGASNNDRGMVESVAETQRIAIENAYSDAGWEPASVGLVECHATATLQGDVEEVKALKAVMPRGAGVALSSYKSQIGHALGASGLMSLVRGVCAMNDGVLPATLNYGIPDPAIGLEEWGFRLPQSIEEWPRPRDGKRRLEVNSFGFGGSNYVALLEEAGGNSAARISAAPEVSREHAGNFESHGEGDDGSEDESAAECRGCAARFFTVGVGSGFLRVAVTADSQAEAQSRLAALDVAELEVIGDGIAEGGVAGHGIAESLADLSPAKLRALARQSVFVESAGASPGKLGLVFAGQGTVYPGMGAALYESMPSFRRRMDRLAPLLGDLPILDLLFHGDEEALKNTRLQQPGLFILEYALAGELLDLGISPTCLAGHSMGELTALSFAGVFTPEDGLRIVDKRAQCMAGVAGPVDDPGVMLAVDAGAEMLEPILRDHPDIFITNLNSPTQTVIGGETRRTLELAEELRAMGRRATRLKVSMVFHSPRMRVIRDELQAFVDKIPFHAPNIPVISNTTGKPFPDDPEEIKKIVMDHLESPVLWIENIRRMREDFGVGAFLEIGPSDVLCSMVQSILPDAICIPSCLRENPMVALASATAELYRLRFFDPPRVRRLRPGPGQGGSPVASQADSPASSPTGSFDHGAALAVVQREVARFALDGVERYLKPAILEALRREISAGIGLHEVAGLMQSLLDGRPPVVSPLPGLISPLAGPAYGAGIASTPAVPTGPAGPAAQALSSPGPRPEAKPETPKTTALVDEDPVVETVIQIIMEVTGYERDEIAPEMDIRKDLTIRSSRLPVIMDAAERRFGISIQVMDFMTVRTVRDIAEVIKELVRRQGGDAGAVPGPRPSAGLRRRIAQEVDLPSRSKGKRAPIFRHVFVEVPLPEIDIVPLSHARGKTIVAAVSNPSGALFAAMERLLNGAGANVRMVNQSAPEAVLAAVRQAGDDLAGLVVLVEAPEDEPAGTVAGLTDWFEVIQAFVAAPGGAFALYAQDRRGIMFEGMLGMFLSASQEKQGARFRCLEMRPGSNPDSALTAALGRHDGIVEIIATPDGLFTTTIQPAPGRLELPGRQQLSLPGAEGGAVVLSGGARGITARVARALAAAGYPLVLCGTTPLDESIDYEAIFRKPVSADEALSIHLAAQRLDPDPETVKRLKAGMEIYSTLADARACGVEAIYRVCDVSDGSRVESLIDEAVSRFGAVAGVIHGAGVLRDSFIGLASPEDFALVCRVKCDGASHLFEATRHRGLRFFAAFSSLAAYQGNIGQAGYCAANRMMAALLRDFSRRAPEVRVKTLWLPPIEGAGMADDPEVREILTMRSLDAAYMDLAELCLFLDMEMFLNEAQDPWVMPARFVPAAPAVVSVQPAADSGARQRVLLGHGLEPRDFPLVDEVENYDPEGGVITTSRSFSSSTDPWLEDHRPFDFIDAPLVSAIVGTENMLEAAALLFPRLKPVRVTSLSFLETIPVLAGATVRTRCQGAKQPTAGSEPASSSVVATVIEAEESEGGWTPRFSGRVHLARELPDMPALSGLPVRCEEIETRPLTEQDVEDRYEERTRLRGRYRVLKTVEGTSSDAIRGAMLYRETDDFALPGLDGRGRYLYSPYILEGFMHLISFFATMRDESEQRSLVPAHIEAIHLDRPAPDGEPIILEGRLVSKTDLGLIFDCRASDGEGRPMMLAQGINLRWIEG
jgi:acyl transferase domain-containing protein/NAD(P)H-dependent flavin oxidoreductase YrpB (nitropropane dioxygenase family)/NAD(P)-dependent dehydrogenase (short-subunit alcohol dehydrogenase family)/acyl carrier protein